MTTKTLSIPADDVCTILEENTLRLERAGRAGRAMFAYTPSAMDSSTYRLSIVIDGVRGHYPLPDHFACGSEEQVRAVADHLNLFRLGLSVEIVRQLITQSMRSERRRS